ncbi:MAG: DNA replication/repair protein RecF [Lachnospiraceae bacterium]|nr:DNA replication/repair protein RecF [Lachnospiraceae bacterium]
MRIRSLKLENYRNYESLNLEFDPGTNILYGDNAQGKTNALEAIYVCATSKSHRGAKDRELIHFDCEEAHIQMIAEKRGVPTRIDMHLKKGRSKGVAVDAVPIRKVTELFGRVNVIFFSPEDLSIIKNSPSERRRFLDAELCQLDRIYTHHLVGYNKIVTQRNRLLKDIEDKPDTLDTLSVWDEQMISYGEPVISRREEFIRELNEIIATIHHDLTGGKENIVLKYCPNVQAGELAREIRKNRGRDLAARVSLSGPHRDDIEFIVNGIDVRHFGSQGQKRTAALSFKLAEIELVKRRIGENPILLLDDVLSELDTGRQTHLLAGLSGVQTIMTCTGLDDFIENSFQIDKRFHVEKGTIRVCE